MGDISYDAPPPYPTEAEQLNVGPEKSDYEMLITEAYNNLGSKINFAQYVGEDQWCVIHLPKSARNEPKSRIRKMLPGGNEKPGSKSSDSKSTNKKSGFLNRFRTGVSTLVSDENNILFGEQSPYELNYYEEEEDGVDTDDLHRYAQKLRELEDTDREVNPEFLVLRDGKTVYAVHEADAEGKVTLSTRKPIYDRHSDQAVDGEPVEKKKLLSRLKIPFGRNKDKDKDGKGSNSPKPTPDETPDSNGKRKGRKTNNKTTDDDDNNGT
ncbi:unnamed protein product [Adineta steineri]|uniref:Uncharacterized protein n=1 Tax=Adineta steineri TaxID=433720 RepID=A0A815HDZ2_9BILA|nr:unnamed protein product [Adineta steineri]